MAEARTNRILLPPSPHSPSIDSKDPPRVIPDRRTTFFISLPLLFIVLFFPFFSFSYMILRPFTLLTLLQVILLTKIAYPRNGTPSIITFRPLCFPFLTSHKFPFFSFIFFDFLHSELCPFIT